jgi:hypothetical protein
MYDDKFTKKCRTGSCTVCDCSLIGKSAHSLYNGYESSYKFCVDCYTIISKKEFGRVEDLISFIQDGLTKSNNFLNEIDELYDNYKKDKK